MQPDPPCHPTQSYRLRARGAIARRVSDRRMRPALVRILRARPVRGMDHAPSSDTQLLFAKDDETRSAVIVWTRTT